jgi:hypothetical protein
MDSQTILKNLDIGRSIAHSRILAGYIDKNLNEDIGKLEFLRDLPLFDAVLYTGFDALKEVAYNTLFTPDGKDVKKTFSEDSIISIRDKAGDIIVSACNLVARCEQELDKMRLKNCPSLFDDNDGTSQDKT